MINETNIYERILDEKYFIREGNARTRQIIRAFPDPVVLSLSMNEKNEIQLPTVRRVSLKTAAAEYAWFRSGSEFVKDLNNLGCHIWDKFAVDGKVMSSYGYRWKKHFSRDQIDLAIEALIDDPSNRQIFISAWDPMLDGLDSTYQIPSVPCEVGFQLRGTKGLFENHLDCIVYLRSSDILVGLPFDVLCKAYLLRDIAQRAKMKPRKITFVLAHAHIYESQLTYVEEGMKRISPALETVPIIVREKFEQLPNFVERAGKTQVNWITNYQPKIEVVV